MRPLLLALALAVSAAGLAACDTAGGPSAIDPPPVEPPPTESPPAFTTAPRLEMAGRTTAFLSWAVDDSTASAQVHYGRVGGPLDRAADASREDSLGVALLDGLDPGAKYAFAVTVLVGGEEAARSDTASFWTRTVELPRAADTADFQRDVVARLTGYLAVRDTLRLRSRFDSLDKVEAATFIEGRLRASGLDPVRHEIPYVPESPDYGTYGYTGQNVYATVPATTSSDEWVLLGTHYDTVRGSPGAVDNATGTSIALAAARHLRQLPHRRYNVMVALFDLEESGLHGSRLFNEEVVGPLGLRLHSMHNFEMTGWDGDRALDFETGRAPRDVVLAYRLAAREADPDVPLQEHDRVGLSDHFYFENGFVLSEKYRSSPRDITPHYHSPNDTYETVDFGYLTSSTQVALNALTLLLSEGGGGSQGARPFTVAR